MPADIRERLLAVQEKAGFIPDVFLASRTGPTRRQTAGQNRRSVASA